MNQQSIFNRRTFCKAAAAGAVLGAASCATTIPRVAFQAAPQGRRARIATVCQAGMMRKTIEESCSLMMDLLDKVLEQKPDLVCLPENFATAGMGNKRAPEKAEALHGITVEAASRRAKKHHCYVVCPSYTMRDGKVYNSAIILDREGKVAGVYDKACPVTTSPDYTDLEGGVTPGSPDIPVFDLDFGRIGIQICFDIGFPENWDSLRKKGAQLVLWPSAYDGGFPLWAYAYLHHYYVMSSVRSGQSRIVDPCGAVLVETQKNTPFVVRDVNLDFIVSHLDWNASIPDKIKAKYGDRVDVRRSNPGCSHFIVEPVDSAITIKALQQEFGFESSFQYHDRNRVAYADIRAGRKPSPQKAMHGVRPQWGKF
jgi:predicted amidohydrolase